MYLFLVIAIGLGNGAGQIKITLVGTIIAFFVVIVFSARRIKDVIKDTGVVQMSITIEKKLSSENVNKLIDEIKKQALSLELISLNKSSKILTINLNLNLKSFEKLNSINDKIIKLYPSANIVVGRDHNISL